MPLRSDDEKRNGFCDECHTRLGLRPLPPSRRPALPCARCKHTELIRCQMRELASTGGRMVEERPVPMAVTYAPRLEVKYVAMLYTAAGPDLKKTFGALEAYVCRACGFTEWYCQAPEDIPIGAHHGTELVTIGESPYR